MKVKVFRECDFCQVETTAPLLYLEVEGFELDVCPLCYKRSGFILGGEEE